MVFKGIFFPEISGQADIFKGKRAKITMVLLARLPLYKTKMHHFIFFNVRANEPLFLYSSPQSSKTLDLTRFYRYGLAAFLP